MTEVATLNVLLHGEPIGDLTHIGGERTVFAFREDYIDDPDRATLGLSFKDEFGDLLTEFRPRQKRLMPFFSNLLPEGRLRDYLAQKTGVNQEREFHLLRALGADLPGAVSVRPADEDEAALAAGTDAVGVREHSESALRFSLAGVQLKFSAVQSAGRGLTIPASGIGGSWIVKLPAPGYADVPGNEYSMMRLADLVGINVPEIDLVDIGQIGNIPEGIGQIGDQAFAIRRFDRLDGGIRVHSEDFAQIFNVYAENKYEGASMRTIAGVLAAEGGEADIVEFIRRLTFNTLIGNGDMHLKNWSLIYPDRRNASLAPAYDFVSTIAYIPDERHALKISRSKEFSDFNEEELKHLAGKAGLAERVVLDAARQTVELFHQHWQAEKANLPMSKRVRDAIDAHRLDIDNCGVFGAGPSL